MTSSEDVESFIKLIRDLLITNSKKKGFSLNPFEVFQNGNCGNLYYFLKQKFPHAKPHAVYYKDNPYHIITEINGVFYDVNGVFSIENYIKYISGGTTYYLPSCFSIKPAEDIIDDLSNNYYHFDRPTRMYISNQMRAIESYIYQQKISEQDEEPISKDTI